MHEALWDIFLVALGYSLKMLQDVKRSNRDRAALVRQPLLESIARASDRAHSYYTESLNQDDRQRSLTLISSDLSRIGRDIQRALNLGHLSDTGIRVAFKSFHDAASNDKVKEDEFPLARTDSRIRRLQEAEGRLRDFLST